MKTAFFNHSIRCSFLKSKAGLILVSAFMAVISASAQESEPQNEISITYGTVANSNFLDIYTEAFTATSGSYFGPLGVEYFHHLSPMVSLGGIGVYKSHKETVSNIETTNSYITIMPAVKLSWVSTRNFGFYSKAGVGYTFFSISGETHDMKDKENTGSFNFQLSAIGLEAGGERFRVFAELGWGEQGLALGGLRVMF